MRKVILGAVLVAIMLLGIQASLAESTVQIFFVACENQAVINLTGNMDAGFDIFYQVFSGAGGTGSPLTSLRQVQVDGAYAFSETIAYNNGATVPAGGVASVRVVIARSTNSAATTYETTVDDIQDGCSSPQHLAGSSVDTGSGAAPAATGPGILSPFGGIINPPAPAATPQPLVVIGPRDPAEAGRSLTPGLIFAECNQFIDRADPGILYDTDNIVIFWSWYARTEELVWQHITNASYGVILNGRELTDVLVSPVQQRDRNYWVFYFTDLGKLEPGKYWIDFNLTWNQTVDDGYELFGPGSDTPDMRGNCGFQVWHNPGKIRMDAEYNRQHPPLPQ